ncbi:hypothetical protein NJ76_00425 [Rhodococcus sp. IITR03]|nr:hypothetical protein NJ76_00425 [Rhodococcus sp. IITR03]
MMSVNPSPVPLPKYRRAPEPGPLPVSSTLTVTDLLCTLEALTGIRPGPVAQDAQPLGDPSRFHPPEAS